MIIRDLMNIGIQNEINFAKIIDRKKLKNLSYNMQELIRELFSNIDDDTIVECWRSKYYEKADIKIKINNIVKGISIKTGHNCSMHQESKLSFYNYLRKIGVEESVIIDFDNFMNGKVNNKKVDAKTYINANIDSIKRIKKSFNSYYIKANLIFRFIFQGIDKERYGCEAIIYGTPDNFIWATKNEIAKFLIEYPENNLNYINSGALYIKCYNRNLKNNIHKIKKQDDIQVKWYTLENDILYISKIREANKSLIINGIN